MVVWWVVWWEVVGNRTGSLRARGKRIVSGGSSADDAHEREHDAALIHAASRVVKMRRVVNESRRERARALMADDVIAEVHVGSIASLF